MTSPVTAEGTGVDVDEAWPRRHVYWVAKALQRERETVGGTLKYLSNLLQVGERTIERLERGDVREGKRVYSYGDDIDRSVAAYAYMAGRDDPRDLFLKALYLWYTEGGIPEGFSADLPGASFSRPIREAIRRKTPARGARKEMLDAMKRYLEGQ